MIVRTLSALALVGLTACGGPDDDGFPTDLRIDGSDALQVPADAHSARMCMNRSGHLFVVWLDARDDPEGKRDAVWLTRSLDRGNEGTWSAPVKVNSEDGNVFAPDIACNGDGVYVVWEDDRTSVLQRHQIFFARSMDDGASFETDILIEDDFEGQTMSQEPKIVAAGSDLYVAWYDDRNGSYDILVNSSSNAGESWHDPVRVDSDAPAGSAYSARPKIAANDAGQVFVTWEDARDANNDIYFARSDNSATTFKEDQRLDVAIDNEPGSSHSFEPQLAVDDQDIYVVWHDERNGAGRDIYLNYSANGGALWLPDAVRVETDQAGFFNSIFPRVVSDRGTAHIVWSDQRQEDAGYDIFYRKFEKGVGVGDTDARLDLGNPEGFANSINARLALGDRGEIVAGWEDGRAEAESGVENNYNDLYYNFSTDEGGSFVGDADLRIDTMCPGQSFKLDLALEVFNQELYAVWIDGRSGSADVYFHRYPLGEEASLETEDGQAVDCSGNQGA